MAPAGRKSAWLSLFYLTHSGKHKCLLSEQQSIWHCFQVSSTAAVRKEPPGLLEMQPGVGNLQHIDSLGSWEQGQHWENPRGEAGREMREEECAGCPKKEGTGRES